MAKKTIEQLNLEKALEAFKMSNENIEKIANLVKRQQLDIKNNQAQMVSQGSNVKQFLEKQSPIFEKTFNFLRARKEGREGGKLSNLLSVKTLGPSLIKGISLGLLKFGVPGAIGAAKVVDLVDSYQDFSKELETTRREEFVDIIGNLIENEKKSKEDVRKILKEQGVSNREIGYAIEAYQDKIDEKLKQSIQAQIENGKTNKEIFEQVSRETEISIDKMDEEELMGLIAEQRRTNEILEEQNDIAKNQLEFSKQVEQNNDYKWKSMRDEKKEDTQDDGIFGNLLSSLGGITAAGGISSLLGNFKGALNGSIPLITKLGQAGLVAGTAFLAFEAGGVISKALDNFVEKITGEKGATVGGKIFDVLHKEDKKITEDEYFSTKEGLKALKSARKKGFEMTPESTRKDLDEFFQQYNEQIKKQKFEIEKKPSISKQIIEEDKKSQINRQEQEKQKLDEDKKFRTNLEKTIKTQQDNKDVTIIDRTKRLDEIPTNTDDLSIVLLSKGSIG